MTTATQKRKAFRARLNQPGIIVAPGCGDGMGARLIEEAGFEAFYMSGYAVEATHGEPDVGLLTLVEMANRAAQLCDVTSIPLIADADTGFGNAVNATRMVREYERAGVVAIQVEDQTIPKKCGSMPDKGVIPVDEMVGKIKAILDARVDSNFLLIARTDIAAFEGVDAVNDRLAAYQEAGADMLLAQGPYTVEGVHDFVGKARAPMMYLNSESFTMPMMTADALEAIGVKLLVLPLSITLSAMHAMRRTLAVIRENRADTRLHAEAAMTSWDDCNRILGLDEVRRIEKSYGPAKR